jgi:EmrB/QacA subfamily drug resistance transporter
LTKLRQNPWVSLVLLSLGFFMILLDTTIVNIAIPSIIDELKASLDQILWVLNAYVLVYAVLLIVMGRLGDFYGQRNLFVAGLVVFTLASAACGAAQDINQLVAARIVQGVGGAMLTPQTLSILTSIFPAERRGAAFGIWGAVAGLAAIAGPTLGGFLVSDVNWRWIFYVNVPIGLFTIIFGSLLIPDLRPGRRHRLDLPGVLLSSAGLFLVVYGLIEGQRFNWGHITAEFGISMPGFVTVPLVIAAGIVLLILFVFVETRTEEPLVPLTLFKNRNYALMNWITGAVAFGMLGLFLPFIIYLQSVLGMSAIQAGLTVIPMSLVSMPVAPFAGRLADRIGGKYILMFGLSCFAAGMGLLAYVASGSSHWYDFVLPQMVAGLGMGCTFAPMTTVAMRTVEPRMAGAASGVFNTTRQLGGVLGSAVVGAVLQNRLATAFRDQAAAAASQLPPQVRQPFVQAFDRAATGGFSVGRGQNGAAFQLPPGIPPQVAAQITRAAHDVFVNGYVNAMRPTLAVPVVVLALGALSCTLIQRRRTESAAARETRGEAAAV